MKIYTKQQIESAIDIPSLIEAISQGLILYSEKKAVISASSLHFDNRNCDVHIKSAALNESDFYVVKIASGFYENPKLGLASSNGLMILFSQRTGEVAAILLDEGLLTDLRTGIAGAICAKLLAPKNLACIGLVGSGTQAVQQLLCLQYVTECRQVRVWSRSQEGIKALIQNPLLKGFHFTMEHEIEEIGANCELIVTTTPSRTPLLFAHQLKPGTHITAVGADGNGKQELDPKILEMADLVIVDSMEQCLAFGDLSYVENCRHEPIELGTLLKNPIVRLDHWISVSDLTGVAIEDLQIAKAIFSKLSRF